MIGFIKKHRIFLIFSFFFFIVLFQHQFLWLYHDDYGYASLSYAVDIGNIGHDYSISDIFHFLGLHYMQWGGRIICFFIECLLLKFGLPVYRLFQSFVILFIFYLIFKLVVKKTNLEAYKVAILTISMYGFLEIMIVRDGIFWVTGAVNYLFPLLTFLLVVYINETNKNENKYIFIIQLILAFLAGFSHEQTSAMTITYLAFIAIESKVMTKKIDVKRVASFFLAFIGFSLLLFCPGSANRLEADSTFSNMTIFERFNFSLSNLFNGFFNEFNGAFLALLFISILYITVINIRNNKDNKLLTKVASVSNIIICCISIFKSSANYFTYMPTLFNNKIYQFLLLILFLFQLFFIAYSFVIYFGKKDILLTKLFISSIASVSVMLISSYYPMRASLGFIIITFIILLIIFCRIFERKNNMKYLNYFMIAICLFSIINYSTITKGYYENNETNIYNDKVLQDSSKKINDGNKIKVIELKKLPDITYSGDQPYIDGFEYINMWIKNYYSIPNDVKIIYK